MTNEIIIKYYGKKKLKTKSIFEKWFFGRNYYFEVYRDITITISNGDTITIPKGFLTDFASIPRCLLFFLTNIDDALLAYILHDYLYVIKYKKESLGSYEARLFADNEMFLLATQLQIDKKLGNYIKFIGVRLFGGLIY